jgi:hypothetical protein
VRVGRNRAKNRAKAVNLYLFEKWVFHASDSETLENFQGFGDIDVKHPFL